VSADEFPKIDAAGQALRELEKPVGFKREPLVGVVKQELAERQDRVETLAGHLAEAVDEIKTISRELVEAKEMGGSKDGKEASALFNESRFKQEREETIRQGKNLMGGNPIFGPEGYLTTEQKSWRDLFAIEVYGNRLQREDLQAYKDKLDKVPPETRGQLCELFQFVFAESVVVANDGSLEKNGTTAASGALRKAGEYLACAPIAREIAFGPAGIFNEFLATSDEGLAMVAHSKAQDSKTPTPTPAP
jgi:hypothetical protein